MMVGKRYYSEADMMRMQRNAEERVREMQERARQTTQDDNENDLPMPPFANTSRNWNTGSNTRNGRNQGQRRQNSNNNNNYYNNHSNYARQQANEEPRHHQEVPPPPPHEPEEHSQERQAPDPPKQEAPGDSTILGDIIGNLGLESDTLLIIGLLLLLVNQKADTTLILALAYLLL